MKSRLLLFSALVIHSFTTAQVGRVELVADILPGPVSSRPEIAGVVNGKFVIGEEVSPDYTDSVYAIWQVDTFGNAQIVGSRDTNYTYRYLGYAFTYKDTAYFMGSNPNHGYTLLKWHNFNNIPIPVVDSASINGRKIDGYFSPRTQFSYKKNLMPFVFYNSIATDSAKLSIMDFEKNQLDIIPSFYQVKYDTTSGYIKFIWELDITSQFIGFGCRLEKSSTFTYSEAFGIYDKSLDTIKFFDLTQFGFDLKRGRVLNVTTCNDRLFIYIASVNFQQWLQFDGNSLKEIPNTSSKWDAVSRYVLNNYRNGRDFVYYYNNKYWLNVLDSFGKSWLASYDPVSNTTQKLYNFRVPNSSLAAFTYYAGDLYFCAETPQPSSNIFVFDGVNPPTLLDNIAQNVNITDARDFHVYNGSLYFSATDSLYGHQYGRELFKYTSPKAAIVKDVEPNAIRTLQVYPNPTNGVLQLEGLPTNAGSLQFQLYNTQGQRLATWEESINNTSYTVPTPKLSHLAMGTYFIQVKSTQAPTTYLASFVKE